MKGKNRLRDWKSKELVEAIEGRPRTPGVPSLTAAEQLFLDRVTHQRDAEVYRNGWPDFALKDKWTGEVQFVEVKWGNDRLSAAQIRICNLLTDLDLNVYVWTPDQPGKLIPWRQFNEGRSEMADRDLPRSLRTALRGRGKIQL